MGNNNQRNVQLKKRNRKLVLEIICLYHLILKLNIELLN